MRTLIKRWTLDLSQSIAMSYQLLLKIPTWARLSIAIALVLSSYVEKYWGFAFDAMPLRVFVAVAMLIFVLQKYWPRNMLRLGPIFWNSWLTLCFPFTFGVILLHNAALTPIGLPLNALPITEYAISLMLMIVAHRGFLLPVLNWLVGTSLALLTIGLYDSPNSELLTQSIITTIPFALTILLFGGIINTTSFKFQQEKEQAIWSIANSIAHQLRTPLATIKNISQGTKSNFGVVVGGYKSAASGGLVDLEFSNKKLEGIANAFESITQEAEDANKLINILIQNSRPFHQSNFHLDLEAQNITKLIQKAIRTFPYNNPYEKSLVTFVEDDFELWCEESTMLHVFYNLIGNGVEFAQKRESGTVNIQATRGQHWNLVRVRDTGPGIPPRDLGRIFEPFFSRNSMNGTGIGLSYCKLVIESIGGKIRVDSEYGKFTEFTIELPNAGTTQRELTS